jgi:hypothetical protein
MQHVCNLYEARSVAVDTDRLTVGSRFNLVLARIQHGLAVRWQAP